MTMQDVAYRWKPIQAPPDPAALARPELRAFTVMWTQQRARLEKGKAWNIFIEKMNRWWCIETGVIERIFDLSIGATQTLIEHGFSANLLSHGDTDIEPGALIEILNDHRAALDMVMDFVGGRRELSGAWIKELHALLCRHQDATEAVTPDGRLVYVPMLKGAYKTQPNNPQRTDGRIHEYCPPIQVASEMENLVSMYQSLPQEMPEVRAAWLHHAFTQIHPFQDGNGRVARALASLDFIRAGLFPVLVRRQEKVTKYIPALERADGGDLSPLVGLFTECMTRVLRFDVFTIQQPLGISMVNAPTA